MSKKLEGKIALVTGGSRGIGAAIAKRLAPEGGQVAINYAKDETFEVAGVLLRMPLPEGRTRPCRARSFQEHHFPNCIQREQK